MIFVKSVSRAVELNKLLVECNFPSIAIHGKMTQEERLEHYKAFKSCNKRILVVRGPHLSSLLSSSFPLSHSHTLSHSLSLSLSITLSHTHSLSHSPPPQATDLAARGIDVERVNIVLNYDMPDGADTYLHRVGRAGRFGTKGLAITFVSSPEDSEVLNAVQERFEVRDSVGCPPSAVMRTPRTCMRREGHTGQREWRAAGGGQTLGLQSTRQRGGAPETSGWASTMWEPQLWWDPINQRVCRCQYLTLAAPLVSRRSALGPFGETSDTIAANLTRPASSQMASSLSHVAWSEADACGATAPSRRWTSRSCRRRSTPPSTCPSNRRPPVALHHPPPTPPSRRPAGRSRHVDRESAATKNL